MSWATKDGSCRRISIWPISLDKSRRPPHAASPGSTDVVAKIARGIAPSCRSGQGTGNAGVYEVCDAVSRRFGASAATGMQGDIRQHGVCFGVGLAGAGAEIMAQRALPRRAYAALYLAGDKRA